MERKLETVSIDNTSGEFCCEGEQNNILFFFFLRMDAEQRVSSYWNDALGREILMKQNTDG